MYEQIPITLTDTQRKKLARAVKKNTEVTLRLSKKNFEDENADIILLTETQVSKLKSIIDTGKAVDIKLSRAQVNKLKSGGFLGALLGGLAASILPGILGIGKGLEDSTVCDKCSGSGVFLSKQPPRSTRGEGTFLKMKERKGNGLFLKHGKNIYDVSDVQVKDGTGIGSLISKFLPKILPVLKGLGKSLLGGLAVGAASEGASQAIKAIAGKRGSGLYLKKGQNIYDITSIVEEMSDGQIRSAKGLLSMLGIDTGSFKNIPIIGTLLG